MEEERRLPDVILPPSVPHRKILDPVGIAIELDNDKVRIWSEETEISPAHLFHWLLGKSAYVSTEQRGVFDSIFKGLPSETLRDLAVVGEASFQDLTLFMYGRDGAVTVRSGNKWGSLANVYKLFPQAKSPREVMLATELAMRRMARYGFNDLDFKSVGRVAQDLVMRFCRFQPRPPLEHLSLHLQSFKGARMEGVVFGASRVYDYDIKSAFPSFVSELDGTRGMEWKESTEVVPDAKYAAILCDVYINETLVRGPIAVRDGQHSLYFPVGLIENVWINKPEIDLLEEYPELGRIVRIHKGSWGVGGDGIKPYRRLLRRLYDIRSEDEFLAPYLKLVMAALWGKFISTYTIIKDLETGEGWTQASPLYNPVFAAHVTSAMRCALYKRSMGLSVVGEFIDGVSTTRPLPIDKDSKLGGFIQKGEGLMVLFSDSIKACSWKNPEILDYAYRQKDNRTLELPMQYIHTLKSAYHKYGPKKMGQYLGKTYSTTQHIRLGSSMRFMGNEDIRVGDLLEGTKSSYPPRMGEMRFFKFMRGVDREENPLEDLEIEL